MPKRKASKFFGTLKAIGKAAVAKAMSIKKKKKKKNTKPGTVNDNAMKRVASRNLLLKKASK
jgi:hypothetical protein